MNKVKEENKILIMLAFFSISVGLWGNFRQLWMQDNNFTVTNISNILSIGTFISCIIIALIGKYVKLDKLKNMLVIVLIIKLVNMSWLYTLNNTMSMQLINLSIIIDIVTEYIIITSIYPLITTIVKTGTIYSKRRLTEYLFRDIGILFGGIFIGKSIAGLIINYNVCLLIANIFLILSFIILLNIKVKKSTDNKQEEISLRHIFKDKILNLYSTYVLIGTIAMSTALGLKMLTLTNYFKFSDNVATNYLLIVGLLADIFGIIALKYLTPKNDYLTMTIKFGIRFLAYVIAFISNNMLITLIAITWSIFISTSYENICDAVYINRLENKQQEPITREQFMEILRIVEEIDRNNIPVHLKNARKIKEWMEKNETTRPPRQHGKDATEEEKKLGRALNSIRTSLINPYIELKTEEEREEYINNFKFLNREQFMEILSIVEKIDENNVPVKLQQARKIREWMEKNKTIKPPRMDGKDLLEEEQKLGITLNAIRTNLINPYKVLKTEEREEYICELENRKKNPITREQFMEILRIEEGIDRKRKNLTDLVEQSKATQEKLEEAKRLESMYEQELGGKEQKEGSDIVDDSK